MRVVIKNKRQLKKMGSESHWAMNAQSIDFYIGASKVLDVYFRRGYQTDEWAIHKRFIRKVIRK